MLIINNNNNNKQRKNMNNFKKIGMTALAASLVSTSVFAGELTVSGSASLNVEAHSGTALNEAKAYTMGNQITFSGSTDLENGLNVAMSYVLDQGDDVASGAVVASAKGPFDGHSITLTHDTLGTIKFSGEGGSSTASSIDTTAAGDMWDNFNSNGGTTVTDSGPGDNSFFYTAPEIVEGLGINLSYKPQAIESATGYGLSYTGVEGLSVSYAQTEINTGTASTDGDQQAWKVSYTYGPVTATASNTEVDIDGTASDQETASMAVSYLVTPDISVTYGTEDIKVPGSVDANFEGIKASYTQGGMTVSANRQDGKDIGNATGVANQVEYWGLGLSFAF